MTEKRPYRQGPNRRGWAVGRRFGLYGCRDLWPGILRWRKGHGFVEVHALRGVLGVWWR